MNNLSFTPRSMLSPLVSIGMFKKTKRKSWAFDGRGARRTKIRDLATTIDNPSYGVSEASRVRCYPVKRLNKVGGYRIFGEVVIGNFTDLKARAKALGFSHVKLGGLPMIKTA